MKKLPIILGVVMLIAGGLIASGQLSFADRDELISVGDAAISVETQRSPSPVLGYVLLGAGAILTVAGVTLRRF